MSTLASLQSIQTALVAVAVEAVRTAGVVTSAGQQISGTLRQVSTDVEEHTVKIGTKLDDLKFFLQQSIDAGDEMAVWLLKLVQGVEDGSVRADAAIQAVGGSVIILDGRVQQLQGLLRDLLPSTGEVQARIRETIKEMGGYEDAMARLHELHSAQALQFAQLVKAYRDGKVSLDLLMRTVEQIRRSMPGSELDALAQMLYQELAQGQRQGRL
jgi:hypothetical protein